MEYKFSDKLAALKPSAIREIFKSLTNPEIIAFAAGNPAAESFPVKEMAEISAQIYADSPVTALQYSQTEGYPPLRQAVSARLLEKFGIGKSTERGDAYTDTTIIVSGGNQGLELACKAFCNEATPLSARTRPLSAHSTPSAQTARARSAFRFARTASTPTRLRSFLRPKREQSCST